MLDSYCTGRTPFLYKKGYNTVPIPVFTAPIPGYLNGYWSGIFKVSSVPFCYWSFTVPFRSVPILLHCTVQQKPPQLTMLFTANPSQLSTADLLLFRHHGHSVLWHRDEPVHALQLVTRFRHSFMNFNQCSPHYCSIQSNLGTLISNMK